MYTEWSETDKAVAGFYDKIEQTSMIKPQITKRYRKAVNFDLHFTTEKVSPLGSSKVVICSLALLGRSKPYSINHVCLVGAPQRPGEAHMTQTENLYS